MTMAIVTALLVNAAVFTVLFSLMLPVRRLLAKRVSAVLQYALWAVVIVKLIIPFGFESRISPLVWFAQSSASQTVAQTGDWERVMPDGMEDAPFAVDTAGAQTAVAEQSTPGATATGGQSAEAVAPPNSSAGTRPLTWAEWALMAWALGVLAVGAVQALGAANLRRRAQHARRPLSERVRIIVEECQRELGVRRRVRVFSQSALSMPLVMGAVRPVLALPEGIERQSDELIRHVCLHKLTHIRRGDLWAIGLLNVLRSIYWFNPMVWLCFKLVRADMETACDAQVLGRIGAAARTGYIGTVLKFAGCGRERRLTAAMGMANARMTMEQRIRGMFRQTHTGVKGRVATLGFALLMLGMVVLTACQPTPETPVVVNKGDGVMESAISNREEEGTQAQPYSAPERLAFEMDGLPDGYRVVFDAQVDVSDQTAWPVYTVEKSVVSQQEADAIRMVLLGDTKLYQPGKYRSREEIQRSIDNYERELAGSEGYPNLIEAYTQILKDLYIEYERTPESLKLEEADTTFAFMESRVMAEFYGGREVITDDGGMRYEWTDEARQRAVDAGEQSIYGVCWTDEGRKMEFSAYNGQYTNGAYYSVAEGNLAAAPGVSCTAEEAAGQADALLTDMGFDFVLVDALTIPNSYYDDEAGGFVDDGAFCHTLTYKRRIDGVPQDNIVSNLDQAMDEEYWKTQSSENYRPEIPRSETIIVVIDDYGVQSFRWDSPMRVTALESAGVTLMPFDAVRGRIEQQLLAQTLWDPADYEKEYIDARRLEIGRIKLSYVLMARKDHMDSYYLAPVWNVCGDMYYHYLESYDDRSETGGYILDKNRERIASPGTDFGTKRDSSILTINAIDGSVIPRHRGY